MDDRADRRTDLSVSRSRLRGVEGVRAIAASAIVVYHCWLWGGADQRPIPLGLVGTYLMPHLALGVTLFFTLSGFLLYRPFVTALLAGADRPSIRAYLRNRVLRILPAYWVILLVVSVVIGAAITPNNGPGLHIGSLANDPWLVVRAMSLLQSYSPATLYLGIGPAWSLAVEVAFYVALPILVVMAWAVAARRPERSVRRLAALAPPLALAALGLSGKFIAAFVAPRVPIGGGDFSWSDVLSYTFWGQADLFAPGMVLAMVYAEFQDRGWRIGAAGQYGLIVAGTLIAIPAALLSYGQDFSPYAYSTLMSVVATLFVALVVLPATQDRAPAQRLLRILESRWVFGLGLISYSLFLWHEPLVHFLREHSVVFDGPLGLLLDVAVIGALSVSLSVVTYRFVESPALRRKRPSTQPTVPLQNQAPLAADKVHLGP